jgi:pyruvate/2-oxoglutarate dehydrogenase complex dihydrolipoamide dehydrogenase (E3) component
VTHLVQHDVELHEEQGIDVQYTGATNIPDVYAVGDVCLYSSFSSIASCLGQGMVVAKTIATNIL